MGASRCCYTSRMYRKHTQSHTYLIDYPSDFTPFRDFHFYSPECLFDNPKRTGVHLTAVGDVGRWRKQTEQPERMKTIFSSHVN